MVLETRGVKIYPFPLLYLLAFTSAIGFYIGLYGSTSRDLLTSGKDDGFNS